MTSYTTITELETDPGAPLTSELLKKSRDNPIAMAEGNSSAPVLASAWHPYNKVTNGDANTGRFYNFATDGAVASVTSPTFVDGYEYQVAVSNLRHSSGAAADFQINLYRETSAAYAGAISVITGTTAGNGVYGHIDLHACRADRRHQIAEIVAASNTGPSSPIVRIDMTSAQKVGNIRILFNGTNITAGELFLLRRKAYYS